MTPERRRTSLAQSQIKLQARADGEPAKQLIEGYAAVYYSAADAGTEYWLWDDIVERIMPGAFKRALAEAQDVRGLLNHDANLLLGRTASKSLRLFDEAKGLRYEIDPDDTTAGRDTVRYLARGDMSGSSFSFQPKSIVWREVDKILVREVMDVDLFDVGPVTFPAFISSTAGVRAAGPLDAAGAGALRQAAEQFLKRSAPEPAAAELDAYLQGLALRATLAEREAGLD